MTVQSRTSRTEIDALEMSPCRKSSRIRKQDGTETTDVVLSLRGRRMCLHLQVRLLSWVVSQVTGCVFQCVCVCPCCILLMFTLSFAYQTTVVYIGGGMPEEDHIA